MWRKTAKNRADEETHTYTHAVSAVDATNKNACVLSYSLSVRTRVAMRSRGSTIDQIPPEDSQLIWIFSYYGNE